MPDPISYTLRFPAPQTHYVEVEARVPTGGRPAVELMMAVWTPGSYLVREFARQVEGLSATADGAAGGGNGGHGGDTGGAGVAGIAGRALAVEKVSKNRWRVATGGAAHVLVRYRLYGRELSVRTNFVDSGFALLNGAATFLTLAGDPGRPHEVRVVLPAEWRAVVSPLPAIPGGMPYSFRAEDFDALVDSPLYAGNPAIHELQVAGRTHLLVDEGEGTAWDGRRAAADLERVVREVIDFWGLVPYSRYVFFNLLTEESGGLEHRDSTVLMTSRWRLRTREGHLDWLSLAAHELFHAWNVKRLRPAALDDFDYERETYTESLWIVEGVTAFYDDLLVTRAGFATRDEYLKRLSKQIETLQTGPGRLVQPLGAASFDAWIKYYRRDENFVNSGTSYYTKGAVVAFLLDAKIRRVSGGRHSLDDALRLAYRRFAGGGYREEEIRRLLSEVAGTDLSAWLARHVDTAEELDYAEALAWYGLRFGISETKDGEDEEEAGPVKEKAGWLGVETEVREGRLVATEVRRGTPAHAAGVNVDDEILAIDDYRVPADGWKDRLKAFRPGQKASLLVARRELLTRLPVTFGEEPVRRWKLEVDPQATAEQREHLAALLAGRAAARPEPAAAPPQSTAAAFYATGLGDR